MLLASMVDRRLNGPYSTDATLHTPTYGALDAHGDAAVTDTTETVRCSLFPQQPVERGELNQVTFQAFFPPYTTIATDSWLTVGDGRCDFISAPMTWPAAGDAVVIEARMARTT